MLILLIANVIVLPVAISFFYNWESKSLLIFNLISDALFLLDIIVNFRTGDLSMLFSFNIEKKKFIISPYLLFMALRYITQWFCRWNHTGTERNCKTLLENMVPHRFFKLNSIRLHISTCERDRRKISTCTHWSSIESVALSQAFESLKAVEA